MARMVIDVSEAERRGGRARARNLTAKDSSEIARAAAVKRWSKRLHDTGIRPAKKRIGLGEISVSTEPISVPEQLFQIGTEAAEKLLDRSMNINVCSLGTGAFHR